PCAAMTLVLAKGICDVRGSSGALEMSVAAGAVPRLRDASANGITQMARSESRINAPRRRCALTDWLVCFFIFILWLNVSRALCEYGRGVPRFRKKRGNMSRHFCEFFQNFDHGFETRSRPRSLAATLSRLYLLSR